MKLLKNENGVALIAVVLVMAVSVILGTAVLSFALSDTRLAENQEHHLQAEYIARAGADAAAQYVQNHPTTNPPSLTDISLGEGTFTAVITPNPQEKTVLISSTGKVSGTTAKVNLKLSKESYSSLFDGIRQTKSNSDLDLESLPISHDVNDTVHVEAHVPSTGDIHLSDKNPDNETDSHIIQDTNYDSPGEIVVPDYTSFSPTIDKTGSTKNSTVMKVTGDAYFETLEVGNKDSLTFNTDGGSQTIVANALTFNGPQTGVKIEGGGSVHLYLLNGGTISNPIVVNPDGQPSQLFIYVCDGNTLTLDSNMTLSAYIAAPNAKVTFQSNQTTVSGAIIAGAIERNNPNGSGANGKFEYVPLSDSVDYSGYLAYTRDYYYGN